MNSRFLTHLGSVSLFHFGILFASAVIMTSETAQQSIGLKVVSFKTAPGVHLGGGGKVTEVRKPKKIAPLTQNMTKGTVIDPSVKKEESTSNEVATDIGGAGKPGDYPGVGGGSAFGNVLADIKTLYKTELRSRIEENKFYPMAARRMGQTGTVIVAFTLLKDGSITDIKIDNSSGNNRLDSAGLEAVKKVGKFKAIPTELNASTLEMTVPIKFSTN